MKHKLRRSAFLLFCFLLFNLSLAQAESDQQILKGDVLVQTAVNDLKVRLTNDYGSDFTIQPGSVPSDIALPAGSIAYEVTYPYGVRLNMPTQAVALIRLNGVVYSKIPFRLNITVYQNVLVAARNLLAGETISEDCFKIDRRDIGRLTGSYYRETDKDKLIGLVLKRGLPEGGPLTESVVDRPILIKRGTYVTLVAHIGFVEVTAKGKSLQDGREGQMIRLQNVATGKTVSGKVLDALTVDVSR